jgi:hypothetical protein
MSRTLGDLVNDARGILQDRVVPYRYSDADLYSHLNTALASARMVRPDLFLPSLRDGTPPMYGPGDAAKEFPLEWQFAPSFVYFMAGRAELSDDEFAQDGRAVALMNKFITDLRGGG